MKEIVVISGKGGTGKTSITAALAFLAGKDAVVADCDVDAADMHLLMQPDFARSEDFYSGEVAEILQDECTQCGKCMEVCRFDAISIIDEQYRVDPISCEGCGYCARVCPTETIINKDLNVGKWFVSSIKTGTIMVHARLGIGADNSGKLVAKVKNEAKQLAKELKKEFILIDGSPGIGCPVVSSLSGADFVVLVTEPSVSGIHDLKRVYELVKKFHIPAGCIINKSDLNLQKSQSILEYLKEKEIVHLGSYPYDESFTKSMTQGLTLMEWEDTGSSDKIRKSWDKTKQILNTL